MSQKKQVTATDALAPSIRFFFFFFFFEEIQKSPPPALEQARGYQELGPPVAPFTVFFLVGRIPLVK